MKRLTAQWVRKAESDYAVAKILARRSDPHHDEVCFHSQQCAEKYLNLFWRNFASPGHSRFPPPASCWPMLRLRSPAFPHVILAQKVALWIGSCGRCVGRFDQVGRVPERLDDAPIGVGIEDLDGRVRKAHQVA